MPKKTSWKFYKNVLQQISTLNTLNDIHNQFVFTPMYNANANVAFICQWFCALGLTKELDLDHNSTGTNNTYFPVHKTDNQVISYHTKVLRHELYLVVHGEIKKLWNSYWTPKIYKRPSEARFIIVLLNASVKLSWRLLVQCWNLCIRR